MSGVLVNGKAIEVLSVFDRGLAYGDGVFRTLKVRAGHPLNWPLHYEKLAADCAAIGIAPPSEALLRDEAGCLAESSGDCVLKMIVTRGESARGYAVPGGIEPTRILMASPLPQYPASYATGGIRVRLCATRLAPQPRLAGVKHLNRLENVLARQEWSDPGIAEGLMLDPDGNVIEGIKSNLFILKGNILSTPDLGRCGVAGVQRARIMGLAGKLDLAVETADIPWVKVQEADEIVLCNSVAGVWQVSELAGKKRSIGHLAASLNKLLDNNEND